jgi:hypothetical protein
VLRYAASKPCCAKICLGLPALPKCLAQLVERCSCLLHVPACGVPPTLLPSGSACGLLWGLMLFTLMYALFAFRCWVQEEPLWCHAVVCTLPLGCLQKRTVAFNPALPGAACWAAGTCRMPCKRKDWS